MRSSPGSQLFAACAVALTLSGSARADAALEEAQAMIVSGDRDQVEAGIQALGMVGTAEAVGPLVQRVRNGLPPDLLDTAIITLMALGQPSAAPVLYDLAAHRRPEVRVRAIEAIVVVQPPDAAAVLRNALGDGDRNVRSAAAQALGELGARDMVDVLFQALDKGNLDASQALGKLLPPTQTPRLLTYLGKIPFRSLAPGLSEILLRKDVAERDKLAVVARVQDVGTPDARAYLGDFLRAQTEKLSPALSRAILQAMQGIAN